MDIPPVVLPPWQAEALEQLLAMPKGARYVVVMPQQSGKRALAAALSERRAR